ncbi:MAG TPA: RNA polymerase sigma-70 factor [Puia sp.]|jgi:RNA polymerase sigma-70 factor (ECF subfamily)
MYYEESILIEGLRKGDMHAFERLFREYYELLCLFAHRYIDNMPVSEEIVADAYAAVWERRETLLISTSFRAYIYRAVRNRCLNHIKHQRIEQAYLDHVRQHYHLSDEGVGSAREEELSREVEEAIESLPERCRQIFKMSRYDDLRYVDIAKMLQLSPKTVERQMMIALEKLRRQLKHLFASV